MEASLALPHRTSDVDPTARSRLHGPLWRVVDQACRRIGIPSLALSRDILRSPRLQASLVCRRHRNIPATEARTQCTSSATGCPQLHLDRPLGKETSNLTLVKMTISLRAS